MSDSPTPSPETADERRAAAFAARVATRDNPPPPPPLPRDRAAVETRVAASLLRAHDVRNKRLRRTLAGFCYGLLAEPRRTAENLSGELACTRQTAAQAAARLIRLGLLAAQPEGRHRYYALTRAGEDWLLPLVTGETAPRPPATPAP